MAVITATPVKNHRVGCTSVTRISCAGCDSSVSVETVNPTVVRRMVERAEKVHGSCGLRG